MATLVGVGARKNSNDKDIIALQEKNYQEK